MEGVATRERWFVRRRTQVVVAVLVALGTPAAVPAGGRAPRSTLLGPPPPSPSLTGSVPAAAATRTPATTAATATTTAPADPAADRFRHATAVAAARQGRVEVSLVELDRHTSYDTADQVGIRSASVIKVAIAVMVLGRGRALTSDQRSDLTSMIEESDNDAATRLWSLGGAGSGLTALARRLGMPGTRPDPGGSWGFTATTAHDLAVLGDAIAEGRALDPAGTATLLGLMRHVDPDQAWGIADAVQDGVPAVKNGWYPDDDPPQWRVHCLGLVGAPPREVLTVMTAYPESLGQGYGERTCRDVAATALDPAFTS